MTSTDRSKTLEYAAIVVGAVAVAASAYFIFMTEGDAFRMTNWVISLAFVVFVAYNFVNVRNLKGAIEALTEKNEVLRSELGETQTALSRAQSDMELVKSDLVEAQRSIQQKEQHINLLKQQAEDAEK